MSIALSLATRGYINKTIAETRVSSLIPGVLASEVGPEVQTTESADAPAAVATVTVVSPSLQNVDTPSTNQPQTPSVEEVSSLRPSIKGVS